MSKSMKFPLRPGLGPTTVHRYVLVWYSLPQKSPGIFILNPSKLLAHNLAWSKLSVVDSLEDALIAGVDAFDLVVDFFLEGCVTEEVDAFGLQLSVATVCDVGFFADECLVADGAVLVQVDASLEDPSLAAVDVFDMWFSVCPVDDVASFPEEFLVPGDGVSEEIEMEDEVSLVPAASPVSNSPPSLGVNWRSPITIVLTKSCCC